MLKVTNRSSGPDVKSYGKCIVTYVFEVYAHVTIINIVLLSEINYHYYVLLFIIIIIILL